jgi:hypothetical protein
MEKIFKPDIEGEIEEFQRTSRDLRRREKINISVEELVRSFDDLKEQTLVNDVWLKLENTESNKIEKNDWVSVIKIARRYKKTNPKKLKRDIENNDYERPLILKMGDRFILIAGNTRLCTAAAMGVNPKVFIGEIVEGDSEESEIDETDTGSSGAIEGPLFGNIKPLKRPIGTIHNANLSESEEEIDEMTSGQFDVPAFGKTTKGGRRDPLKVDGPNSIYKGRAVKDKKFPKWGGPGGVFVKVKEKCKKFPYCNQGNTGALEFINENETIKDAITEASKKYGIPYKEIEKIVINDISKIFI